MADAGATVLVTLNALRLLRFKGSISLIACIKFNSADDGAEIDFNQLVKAASDYMHTSQERLHMYFGYTLT